MFLNDTISKSLCKFTVKPGPYKIVGIPIVRNIGSGSAEGDINGFIHNPRLFQALLLSIYIFHRRIYVFLLLDQQAVYSHSSAFSVSSMSL